jgi:hypothetical protein
MRRTWLLLLFVIFESISKGKSRWTNSTHREYIVGSAFDAQARGNLDITSAFEFINFTRDPHHKTLDKTGDHAEGLGNITRILRPLRNPPYEAMLVLILDISNLLIETSARSRVSNIMVQPTKKLRTR